MFAHDKILRPVVTEKSMGGLSNKEYTFKVRKNANKIEIAKAVEEAFGVEVDKVRTISVCGKEKRMGRYIGRTPSSKKAIVKLTEKSKSIEFFENMN